MKFLNRAQTILNKPQYFFDHEVKSIKGWKAPIDYFITFSLLVTVFLTIQHVNDNNISIFSYFFNWFFNLFSINIALPKNYVQNSNFFVVYIILATFLITSSLIRYSIIHWFVSMWKKNATFENTTKALAFSSTPGWVGMPFFVLSGFSLYAALALGGPLLWILTVVTTAIFLGFEAFSIYLRTYALSKVQGIRPLQAFLAIYVYSNIAYSLLVIMLLAALLGLMIGFLTVIRMV